MLRRAFLQSLTAGVAWGADESPRPVTRVTRLFDREAATKLIPFVPQVLPLADLILGVRKAPTVVFAVKPDGTVLWQHTLPQNQFLSIAGTVGNSLLLQSIGSGLQRLNTADGSTTRAKSNLGLMDRLFPAGDGYAIQASKFKIDLWNIAADPLELRKSHAVEGPELAQVDAIAPGLATITAADGRALWTVEIPSGKIQAFEPDSVSVRPFQLVTGADREGMRLLWLFTPSAITAPLRMISIDAGGNIEPAGSFERKCALPIRVMKYGGEIGIAYSEGSVAWYKS